MAKKAATFPDAILVNKVMSASAPAFVRLAGGKGGGDSLANCKYVTRY